MVEFAFLDLKLTTSASMSAVSAFTLAVLAPTSATSARTAAMSINLLGLFTNTGHGLGSACT